MSHIMFQNVDSETSQEQTQISLSQFLIVVRTKLRNCLTVIVNCFTINLHNLHLIGSSVYSPLKEFVATETRRLH